MLKARFALIAIAALLASPGVVFAGGGKINWTKWKTAKAWNGNRLDELRGLRVALHGGKEPDDSLHPCPKLTCWL